LARFPPIIKSYAGWDGTEKKSSQALYLAVSDRDFLAVVEKMKSRVGKTEIRRKK